MNDKEIIIHQAKKIAELEVKLDRYLVIDDQLHRLMGKRDGDSVLVLLSKDEAELIDHYRRATPEGKVHILTIAKRLAAESKEQKKSVQESPAVDAVEVKMRTPALKRSVASVPAPDLSGLPAEFFSPKTTT